MPFQKGHKIWLGRKHSKEAKEKMRKKHKGKKLSKETKDKMGEARKGEKNPMYGIRKFGKESPHWKNGKAKGSQGYMLILKPEHPFCKRDGYVREHRLVVEQQIGRYLLPKERSHHIGIKYLISSIKNKQDNRPENLMAFTNESAHQRFHNNPNNVKSEEIIFDGRKL